tara:strand:+ start:193 stop:1350 length:1158 start_codon:yes stop_codon:yes gene_type:complete
MSIQNKLFKDNENVNNWQNEWVNMPEYNNVKQDKPKITATFKFRNNDDYEIFKNKVKKYLYNDEKVFDGQQKIDEKQAWFPLREKDKKYYYLSKGKYTKPRFPIYIVSKGRWQRNPTSKMLEKMNVPFFIIVEKQEYKDYLNLVDKKKILILPQKYKDNYDHFWKDDDTRTGPGCARNYAWEHSIKNGHKWHWVMDDNIESFERFNNNKKIRVYDGSIFYVSEDFVLRYENIAIAGLQYANFMPHSDFRPPFKLNTRIYSCLLIKNDIPYRWRGRYNEDTDLSIRALKDGWTTIQFNAFLQGKRATQTVKGGCDKEFYENEGTLNKSQILVDMHPDITKVVKRFNRWHHYVNYKVFKNNKLIKKKNINYVNQVNEFGQVLKKNES